MVEIALSLGIIGFALVAIIGVLPMGLNTQKDNREETIINQEGQYWIETIRNGAQGFEVISNFVDFPKTNVLVYMKDIRGRATQIYPANRIVSVSNLVGLITTPKGTPFQAGYVDKVSWRSRAMSGTVAEQNPEFKDMAFAYEVTSEVTPFRWGGSGFITPNNTQYFEENRNRERNFLDSQQINGNLYELKLTFKYPLTSKFTENPRGRKVFRTLIAGNTLNLSRNRNTPSYFLVPQNFAANTNAP